MNLEQNKMSNKLGRILLIVLIKILCFCGEDNVNAMDEHQKYMQYYYGDYAADQPDNTNNEDENYIILIGTVKIGKEKNGELSYRRAEENEMMIEIFCGKKLMIDGIFTDKNGQFEASVGRETVNSIKNCKPAVYIGFYTHKSLLSQKLYSFVQNRLDAKKSSIKKMYAKVETKYCLRFSKKLKTNEEFMNKFKVSFDQKTIYINEAKEKAEIKSNEYFKDELTYRISREFTEKSSSEAASSSAASSGENKMKNLVNSFSSVLSISGKNKEKKEDEQYKQKHLFDLI